MCKKEFLCDGNLVTVEYTNSHNVISPSKIIIFSPNCPNPVRKLPEFLFDQTLKNLYVDGIYISNENLNIIRDWVKTLARNI